MKLDLHPEYVLLDRDGVLNEQREADYVTQPDQLVVLPGAAEAVARLNRNGYECLVISNQQGVGKGLFSLEELDAVTARLRTELERDGGRILDFFYCPHLASDECPCRKPKTGLIEMAAERYGFDPTKVFFVGDSFSDMEAAARARCRAVFVLTGLNALRYEKGEDVPGAPEYVALDLGEAVDYILRVGQVSTPAQ